MTTGSVLYLAMSIGGFVLFAAVLAYQSWQGSRVARSAEVAPRSDPHRAITA